MELNDLTGEIVDCAFQVHKHLGPGLLEVLYEEALCYELSSKGLDYQRQKEISVPYKDTVLQKKFIIDILVDDRVVVELKNCDKLLPIHEAQIMTYMRLTENRIGLLFNFNSVLMKSGIKRMIL